MTLTERSVELPWLVAHIGMPRRLLDIGSADAVYVALFYELCRDLWLCDTREFAASAPVEKYIGSAHQLPADWRGCFDLVTCVSVLDHVGLDAYGNTSNEGMLPAMIAEMHRVLVEGGRLLVTVPVGRPQVTTHPQGGQRVFAVTELLALFDASAWTIQDMQIWKLQDERYTDAKPAAVAEADYLTWRAEAVAALEVVCE